MSTDETYNGWSSRETWAWALWINNDQGLQEMVHELAQTTVDWEIDTHVVWKLEEALRDWTSDLFDPEWWKDNFGSEMPREIWLMRDDVGSTWRIDWREVAESILTDLDYGTCDECSAVYETSSREGRCGDCGNCADHCEHETKED